MLEMLVNPKKGERHPFELFFVGLVYAGLSTLLVNLMFAKDPVLSKYLGVLIVTFTVMFSMPFVYYTIKLEEKKVSQERGTMALLKEHKKAIYAFLWLFLGFVIAFSLWYILFGDAEIFRAQIETYCSINRPSNVNDCISQYGLKDSNQGTLFASSGERFFQIFKNNILVLLFTLVFSLIFGAGVIFILAWNASVISAAIGIFSRSQISELPAGLLRYMVHGIPEIASYFIVALAGGMVSVAIIRHEVGTERFWEVLADSLTLVFVAVLVLFVAGFIEVFITPNLFY